jgi:hypothetical protein
LRTCGEEIRLAAAKANRSLDEVPDSIHRSVDDATRDWARYHEFDGAVLEGRFLDQVLADEPGVVFVRASCDSATRIARWAGRVTGAFCAEDLAEIDKADDLFRLRMYHSSDKGAAQITLDTSSAGVDQWADELLKLMEALRATGRG